jgi:hypothetical protein
MQVWERVPLRMLDLIQLQCFLQYVWSGGSTTSQVLYLWMNSCELGHIVLYGTSLRFQRSCCPIACSGYIVEVVCNALPKGSVLLAIPYTWMLRNMKHWSTKLAFFFSHKILPLRSTTTHSLSTRRRSLLCSYKLPWESRWSQQKIGQKEIS